MDAFRIFVGTLECSPVANAGGIKHDYIRELTRSQSSPSLEFQALCGKSSHFAYGLFKRNQVRFAQGRECARGVCSTVIGLSSEVPSATVGKSGLFTRPRSRLH
jgi:hypothetical protein